MVNDPAWDMPEQNWQQQGSFEVAVAPPTVDPAAGTLVCAPAFAAEWLPFIQGSLDQMRNPSSWTVADDAAMAQVLQWVDKLKRLLAMSGSCCDVALRLQAGCILQYSLDGGATWIDVAGWAANFAECVRGATIPSPPLLPPGSGNDTRACNIASYIANQVIREAIAQAINAYDNNLSLLALAGNIAAATFAFELPWTAAFIYAVYDVYAYFTLGNIADLRTSEADATLWSLVTCAIYDAIRVDGAITSANCAAVIANLCAISYVRPVAITAICTYVTQLGCDQLRSLQVVGALVRGDCSGCAGNWCYEWDFRVGGGGWVGIHGSPTEVWMGGVGWTGNCVPATGYIECDIKISLGVTAFIRNTSLWASCPSPSFGGQQEVQFWHAGVLVHTIPQGLASDGSIHHYTPDPLATFAVDEIHLVFESNPCSGNIVLQRFQISGAGASPFSPASPCMP